MRLVIKSWESYLDTSEIEMPAMYLAGIFM
jgi:hypothetical protein